MSNAVLASLGGRGQRRFDLFRIVAPALALMSLVLAVISVNPAAQLKYVGLVLMMGAMSVYVFRLRGLPITQRPPVVFTPLVLSLVGIFCLGTILTGYAMGSAFGLAVMFVPTATALASSVYLRSPQGLARREQLAQRDC